MKTDAQYAEETVKVVTGLLGLMQPRSKIELDRVIMIASMLVEASIKEHVEQALARSAEVAKNGMEGK